MIFSEEICKSDLLFSIHSVCKQQKKVHDLKKVGEQFKLLEVFMSFILIDKASVKTAELLKTLHLKTKANLA